MKPGPDQLGENTGAIPADVARLLAALEAHREYRDGENSIGPTARHVLERIERLKLLSDARCGLALHHSLQHMNGQFGNQDILMRDAVRGSELLEEKFPSQIVTSHQLRRDLESALAVTSNLKRIKKSSGEDGVRRELAKKREVVLHHAGQEISAAADALQKIYVAAGFTADAEGNIDPRLMSQAKNLEHLYHVIKTGHDSYNGIAAGPAAGPHQNRLPDPRTVPAATSSIRGLITKHLPTFSGALGIGDPDE